MDKRSFVTGGGATLALLVALAAAWPAPSAESATNLQQDLKLYWALEACEIDLRPKPAKSVVIGILHEEQVGGAEFAISVPKDQKVFLRNHKSDPGTEKELAGGGGGKTFTLKFAFADIASNGKLGAKLDTVDWALSSGDYGSFGDYDPTADFHAQLRPAVKKQQKIVFSVNGRRSAFIIREP